MVSVEQHFKALHKGEILSVTINYDWDRSKSYHNMLVKINQNEVGKIDTKRELLKGYHTQLPDGRDIKIKLQHTLQGLKLKLSLNEAEISDKSWVLRPHGEVDLDPKSQIKKFSTSIMILHGWFLFDGISRILRDSSNIYSLSLVIISVALLALAFVSRQHNRQGFFAWVIGLILYAIFVVSVIVFYDSATGSPIPAVTLIIWVSITVPAILLYVLGIISSRSQAITT